MKEIPILMSTPMVQAILQGRKTKTRRIIKPQPIWKVEDDGNLYEGNHKGYVKVDGHPFWGHQFAAEFAKWEKGDILWVRETWQAEAIPAAPEGDHDETVYRYKASEKTDNASRWKPCIHMPKGVARIWLQVTDVRVERLQHISEEDAKAEGVELMDYFDIPKDGIMYQAHCYREAFESLWKVINGADSWRANPWVWVISFEVLSTSGKPTPHPISKNS